MDGGLKAVAVGLLLWAGRGRRHPVELVPLLLVHGRDIDIAGAAKCSTRMAPHHPPLLADELGAVERGDDDEIPLLRFSLSLH
uniref:Uncharacterized protein n=1 Tax=Oryza meridionalis TaxID=40149 RepID=A0A0E0DCG6_9ORYZ